MFLLLVYAFAQQILSLQVNIIYMYTKCIALLPHRSMFMPVNFVILFNRTPKNTKFAVFCWKSVPQQSIFLFINHMWNFVLYVMEQKNMPLSCLLFETYRVI